ncbi:hypothetical protein SLA2020_177760 [Shorea laevis]
MPSICGYHLYGCLAAAPPLTSFPKTDLVQIHFQKTRRDEAFNVCIVVLRRKQKSAFSEQTQRMQNRKCLGRAHIKCKKLRICHCGENPNRKWGKRGRRRKLETPKPGGGIFKFQSFLNLFLIQNSN